jgi:hypothetical protein
VGHGPGGAAARPHGHLRGLEARGARALAVLPSPKQPGRRTPAAVAWAAVLLRPPPPGQARGRRGQGPLPAWALRAWEVSPPPPVAPLEWLLVSDVPVASLEQAWQRVDWYARRWPVAEEYHKAQKAGCQVEGPQFTTAQALRPTIGVLSVVAWLLLRLRWLSRRAETACAPAAGHVPRAWVAWPSRWRLGREEAGWTVREFFLALARRGAPEPQGRWPTRLAGPVEGLDEAPYRPRVYAHTGRPDLWSTLSPPGVGTGLRGSQSCPALLGER